MKAIRFNKIINNIFSGVFTILIIFSFNSCAKKIDFLNSTVVPAAQGYVKIKKDNNENFVLKIRVTDLAEIERLESTKLTYVVWMTTDRGKAENLGQLKSTTGFLSKQLKASLVTVSSYKPVKVFITSEFDINIQTPGSEVVLSTPDF